MVVGNRAVGREAQHPQPFETATPLRHHEMTGEGIHVVEADVVACGEHLLPVVARRRGGGRDHQREVGGAAGLGDGSVGEDVEAVAGGALVMLDVVLVALGARLDDHGRGRRVGGGHEPHFAGDLRRRGDDEVAPGAGAPDRHVEAVVVFLEQKRVVGGGSAERVAPHLPRAHGVVGTGVEDRGVVGPGDPVVDVVDDVVEHRARVDLSEAQRVALTAGDVGADRDDALVGGEHQIAHGEVVVPVGEGVLVEHDDLALGRAGGHERVGEHVGADARAAAVHRVLAALDGAAEVLEWALRGGRGGVGLLDPPDDLVVDATAQRAEVGGGRRGVAVLGLEVGDHLGVVTSAEPEPRVDALVAAVAQHVRARGRDRGGRRGGSAGRSLFCHGRILADRCDIEGHVPVPR